ncbi:restriction endonuclease subunit S [Alkaliphilus hydrothermalis]|uniref:Type I restriction enzyme S subunit n=1 Tax=Alkaliphilus hydrothermalis TaxID=1482730 RepID=A0ABS2NPD3_9FIRM|nr:restriction endonuclease subunit S [Alkaliphilus hydrothermalis]MBM7614808.1 type I restriction enzyme S subunit [Alkaliphilus hydrothermalis]
MKKVREGYKMTDLGEIPESWNLRMIREVVNINPESLGNKTNKDFILNYIDIESVSTGVINNTKVYSFDEAPSRARRKVRKNDVIISTVRPYLKAFAIVKDDLENLVCSTGFAVLRAKENIEFQYIYQCTLSDGFLNQLSNKMVGSNYPAVNSTDIQETLIPVPPLNEQQKIASMLSSVDQQIEITDNLIEKTKELKKGLMQKLLTKGIGHTKFKDTEIGRIPEEWEVKDLGEVFKLSSGNFLSQKNIVLGEYPVYGGNGITGYHNQYLIEESKIVIGRVGAKCGCVCISEPKSWITDNALFISDEITKFEITFMFYLLGYLNLNQFANQNAQPVISGQKIYQLKVPLPDYIEQQKISAILLSVDNQIEKYESKRESLQTLKKGLMQKLLTGKIRVKV